MTEKTEAEEYVTAAQAAALLNVSKVKMARMLDKGVLPYERNPLDTRQKLIPLAAVQLLKEEGRRKRVSAPKVVQVA